MSYNGAEPAKRVSALHSSSCREHPQQRRRIRLPTWRWQRLAPTGTRRCH